MWKNKYIYTGKDFTSLDAGNKHQDGGKWGDKSVVSFLLLSVNKT